jgi:uncharacterized repeat protein (TIGR02543 family)
MSNNKNIVKRHLFLMQKIAVLMVWLVSFSTAHANSVKADIQETNTVVGKPVNIIITARAPIRHSDIELSNSMNMGLITRKAEIDEKPNVSGLQIDLCEIKNDEEKYNNDIIEITRFTYTVTPQTSGDFTIPPFAVKFVLPRKYSSKLVDTVIKTKPLKLHVSKITVTFDSAGGTNVAPRAAIFNAPLALPPEPTREGYRFAGWFAGDCEKEFNSSTKITNTGNFTLYAKWRENNEQVDEMTAVATLDKKETIIGEHVNLRIEIKSSEGGTVKTSPNVPGLKIEIIEKTNKVYTYKVTPDTIGVYEIPSFKILVGNTIIKTNSLRLEVAELNINAENDPSAAALKSTIADLKYKSELGDIVSQALLGYCYMIGKGVPKSVSEAVRLWSSAAQNGDAMAMFNLGLCYDEGIGTKKDINKATNLILKAAEQGNAQAQMRVGLMYLSQEYFIDDVKIFMRFQGNSKYREKEALYRDEMALIWFTKAAEQGDPEGLYYSAKLLFKRNAKEKGANYFKKSAEKDHGLSQSMWGNCLYYGDGVTQNKLEAVKWYRKAAEKNIFSAQFAMAMVYLTGQGDVKNEKEAYKWALIALTHSSDDESTKNTKEMVSHLESILSKPQIDEARQMAKSFLSGNQSDISESRPEDESAKNNKGRSGTGFFITTNGFIITNRHVVENATKIEVITKNGNKTAQVVKSDISHDLALLKIDGDYDALAILSSKNVKMGHSAFTIGFPNINLQGFSPKYTKGNIAALSGVEDDSSCFQISVPIQPGNSGGALINDQGNVIGVICSKLSAEIALDSSGSLPENVNYAIKSSFLLAFLESVDKLKNLLICPESTQIPESEILDKATSSTVLIFAYTD